MQFLFLVTVSVMGVLYVVANEESMPKQHNVFVGGTPMNLGKFSQMPETVDPTHSRKRRQLSTLYNRWPNGEVYFYLDKTVGFDNKYLTPAKLSAIDKAFSYIMDRTCVTFYDNAAATNKIRIFSGNGCNSVNGMNGGTQDLSFGDGCELNSATVVHELMHSLGMYHTQQRDDRDAYVTVNEDKLYFRTASLTQDLIRENYDMKGGLKNTTPYEYGSVMHYRAVEFPKSPGDITISPKNEEYLHTMGSNQVSFYDMKMINDHYDCHARCPFPRLNCANGGYPNPRDCSKCNCPSGYGGILCDQRPGCGMTLAATADWDYAMFFNGDVSNFSNFDVRDDFNPCTYWITAPVGKKVQVRVNYMWNEQCTHSCPLSGVEIKKYANPRIVNPRICCRQFTDIVHTSELNPTPILSWARYRYTVVEFGYRYVDAVFVPPKCVDANINCDSFVKNGFCTNTFYTVEQRKATCGQSCNLC